MTVIGDTIERGEGWVDVRGVKWPTKGSPQPWHARAFEEAGLKPGHAFWVDPGGGKTFLTIAEAGHLYLTGKIDALLVVAPNGPHQQWVEEQFPQWAAYPWVGIHNRMTKTEIKRKLQEMKVEGRDAMGVAAINFESARVRSGWNFIDDFLALYDRVFLAVDESQNIGSPDAITTIALTELSKRMAYRRVMTGTPMTKGIEKLYSQYNLAFPYKCGFGGDGGYFAYRSFFCDLQRPEGRSVDPRAKVIVGYKNEDILMRNTAPYVTRIMEDEFGKGEAPIMSKVSCPMSNADRAIYDKMRQEMILDLERGQITVASALVKIGKLHQMASGFVYLPPSEEHVIMSKDRKTVERIAVRRGMDDVARFGDHKVKPIVDLVEQLDEHVIIWAPFTELQAMIREALEQRLDVPVMTYAQYDDIELWKKRGGVIIGHQGSGMGVGLNLQFAAANIYAANDRRVEKRWQSLKRTDRPGQDRRVRVWDMVTPNTVDGQILRDFMEADKRVEKNINAMRGYVNWDGESGETTVPGLLDFLKESET